MTKQEDKKQLFCEPFDKDDCAIILQIHNAHRRRFDQRITHSWKLILGLWTALGFFAYSITKLDKIVLTPGKIAIVVVVLLGVLVVQIYYMITIFKRNKDDRDMAWHYLEKIEKISGEKVAYKWEERFGKYKKIRNNFVDWTWIPQIMITVLFELLVVLALIHKNK